MECNMRNPSLVVFSVILLVISLSCATQPVQAAAPVGERVLLALNRGYVYLCNGNYDRAIAEYTTALALQPNSLNALINRGLAHIGIVKCNYVDAKYGRQGKYFWVELFVGEKDGW